MIELIQRGKLEEKRVSKDNLRFTRTVKRPSAKSSSSVKKRCTTEEKQTTTSQVIDFQVIPDDLPASKEGVDVFTPSTSTLKKRWSNMDVFSGV